MSDASYWVGLYHARKHDAVCLDVEVCFRGGPVSVVGLYRPRDGLIECEQYIRGQNLSLENLQAALLDCTLLITFNGLSMDLPRLKKEFPSAIPNVPVVDLYRLSRHLGVNASLNTWENTFDIERLDSRTKRKFIAVKLWKKFNEHGDQAALDMLLEYNKQDTVNLYPLAERLVGVV